MCGCLAIGRVSGELADWLVQRRRKLDGKFSDLDCDDVIDRDLVPSQCGDGLHALTEHNHQNRCEPIAWRERALVHHSVNDRVLFFCREPGAVPRRCRGTSSV